MLVKSRRLTEKDRLITTWINNKIKTNDRIGPIIDANARKDLSAKHSTASYFFEVEVTASERSDTEIEAVVRNLVERLHKVPELKM